jgi:hypothetical protein
MVCARFSGWRNYAYQAEVHATVIKEGSAAYCVQPIAMANQLA